MERKMDVIKAITTIAGPVMILLFSTTFSFTQTLTANTTSSASQINYWVFSPESYVNSVEDFPVIIFLHGKGERGDGTDASMKKILTHGPLKHAIKNELGEININGRSHSFLILAPQLNAPANFWEPALIHEFINYALDKYRIDTNRIYLTGLSMGGNGVWNYAYSNYNKTNRLAAIAPIAAWGNPNKVCIIKERKIPVWAFHGKKDQTVPYDLGLEIFDALKKCNNDNNGAYRFTTYEKIGHNSWSNAYNPSIKEEYLNLYEWFLSHSRQENSPASNKLGNLDIRHRTSIPSPKENNVSLKLLASLPPGLKETSGLALDKSGNLWTHNDGGSGSYLIQINNRGEILEYKKVIYASNFDWEALANDQNDNLYIGDIGNNENKRKTMYIYQITSNETSDRIKAKTISYNYPDQKEFPPPSNMMNYDAEAMIYLNNFLYIFTKNRTEPFSGIVNIYKVPAKSGHYSAERVDQLLLDDGGSMYDGWVTGADISQDGETLVLLGHRKIWIVTCFQGDKFSTGKLTQVLLDHFTQKEAVAFASDTTLYITDEKYKDLLGGNLYSIDISPWLSTDCR